MLPILVWALLGNNFAQQTNPVERQVANPITDTPNVNPVANEQEVKVKPKKKLPTEEGGDGELVVYSENQTAIGKEGNRVVTHTGAVDARYGIYRMQADKMVVYEATNKLIAEGSADPEHDDGNDGRSRQRDLFGRLRRQVGPGQPVEGFRQARRVVDRGHGVAS